MNTTLYLSELLYSVYTFSIHTFTLCIFIKYIYIDHSYVQKHARLWIKAFPVILDPQTFAERRKKYIYIYVRAYALKYTGVLGTGIKLRTTFSGPHLCPCIFFFFFAIICKSNCNTNLQETKSLERFFLHIFLPYRSPPFGK